MSRKINWTPEMDKFIRDNYKSKTDREIGRMLGYKRATIYSRREQLGLTKHIHSHCPQMERLEELELYNSRLNKLKQSIKINDRVEVAGNGIRKVVEKYPNFIVCVVNGFKESILYTDIKRIVDGGMGHAKKN